MAQVLNKADIQKRVEGMQNGSVEVFFMARSPAKGGPLGAGAAVVELNPDFDKNPKKAKKYLISFSDVEGDKPVGKKTAWFGTSKVNDVVNNIWERHEPWQ